MKNILLLKKRQTAVRINGVDYKVKYAPTPSKACSKCSLCHEVHCGHSHDCLPFDKTYYSYFDEIEKKEYEEKEGI